MLTPLDMNSKRILNLPAPVNGNEPARLVDVQNSLSGLPNASLVPFTPTGSVAAVTVQGAIEELDTEVYASIAARIADLNAHMADTSTHGIASAIVGTSEVQILTNKTVDLTSNTVTGTKAQFDTACSNGNFVFTDTLATDTTTGAVELATTAEVAGVRTTGTITSGTAALTVASSTGIVNGMHVSGEGITPGTYVVSGGGTTSLTLSANANATLAADPVGFYSNSVVLTPASTAGMLARAWVNFNGTGTVAIRAAHNVTSITDGGTGVYTVNFTTAMQDVNYACSVTAGGTSTSASGNVGCGWAATYATGSVAIGVSDNNTDTNADFANMNIAIFR